MARTLEHVQFALGNITLVQVSCLTKHYLVESWDQGVASHLGAIVHPIYFSLEGEIVLYISNEG